MILQLWHLQQSPELTTKSPFKCCRDTEVEAGGAGAQGGVKGREGSKVSGFFFRHLHSNERVTDTDWSSEAI